MTHDQASKILGVDRNADPKQVQEAYRDLAKVWHPDRFASDNERLRAKAEERFKEIRAAYDLLNGAHPALSRGPDKPWVLQMPRVSMVRFWIILSILSLVALRFGLVFRSLVVSVVVVAIIVALALRFSRMRAV